MQRGVEREEAGGGRGPRAAQSRQRCALSCPTGGEFVWGAGDAPPVGTEPLTPGHHICFCLNRAQPSLPWPVLIFLLRFTLGTFQNLSKDGKGLYLTKMEVRGLPLPETAPSPRPPLLTDSRGIFLPENIEQPVKGQPSCRPPCLQLLPLYIADCQGCFRILADRFYFFPIA